MREFLKWLAKPTIAKILNTFFIFLASVLLWLNGSLLVRWALVSWFGFSLYSASSYLFPYGSPNAFWFLMFFWLMSSYIHFRWERRGEKNG